MRSIKRMPKSVFSTLRSSVIFSDLTRVVEELIFNSVDAGATKVNVFVSVGASYIKVEDDGCGISRDELVLLGEKYATSKFHSLAEMDAGVRSLGFRGEALGSLSDISLLEVITKARGKPNGYRKVIKGCKSLFLGIDDYRQDVGTTVIVRDLFYNQPVRRRCMQTSSKVILHSVKQCALQIALVYPQVSFKVMDIEGEDDLLFTLSSLSPLPLVASAFGNEVSSSLCELNFSEGVFKISGYLSGPADTFSMKVFQYIYVNSRSVCKGPIHKLLNSLTANLECSLISWRDQPEFQMGKRHRMQTYAAYMLKLCCPKSCYDLTFESSKTVVEFKEWSPVLSFIEKAVKHFWRRFPSYFCEGESHGHEIDVQGKSKISKEDLCVGNLSEVSETAKKKSKMKHHLDSSYLSPSTGSLEMLSADFDFLSDQRLSRESNKNDTEIKGCQSENMFVHETDYSLRNVISAACDDSDPKSSWMAHKKGINLRSPDNKFFSEDRFLSEWSEGTVLREMAKDDVQDDVFCSRWRNESRDIDATLSGRTTGSSAVCDLFYHRNDTESVSLLSHGQGVDRKAIFTNSPSMGDVPDDSVMLSNQSGSKSRSNDLKTPSKWLSPPDTSHELLIWTPLKEKHVISHRSSSVIRKCERVTEFDMFSFDSPNSDACDRMWPREQISCTSWESGPENESPAQVGTRGSNCQLTNSAVCFGSSHPVSDAASWKGGDFSERYMTGENFMSCERINFRDFHDREEGIYFSNQTPPSSSTGYDHLASTYTDTRFDYKNCFSLETYVDTFVSDGHRENESIHKTIGSFSEINDYMCFGSSSNDTTGNNATYASDIPSNCQNKVGKNPRKEMDVQNFEQYLCTKVRSMRSRSAPPFYRGRKKFSLLNNFSSTKSGIKPNLRFFHDTPTVPVTNYELKDSLVTSGLSLPYVKPIVPDDSLARSRTYVERRPCRIDNIKSMQKTGGHGKSHCIQSCNFHTDTDEDLGSDELQHSNDTLTKWRSGDPWPTGEDKPKNLPDRDEDEILDISSGLLHLAGPLVPESISKSSLESAKVLPQLDRKFIPIMAGGILAIIDQHAADERIRLEELRLKVLSGEGKTVAYLDSEQELVLAEIGFQLLQNYAEQIEEWGWICNIHAQGSGSFTKNMNLLHKRPFTATLVAVPCVLGINLSDKDLVEFLEQLAETDGTSTMPPAVLRILNFKACRGAIMFGDSLLPSECSLIVEELKATSLCFQCAHGRPTTVPLVNLEALHKQLSKLRLQNGELGEQWHGLRRHKPSLERAKQRLSSACM